MKRIKFFNPIIPRAWLIVIFILVISFIFVYFTFDYVKAPNYYAQNWTTYKHVAKLYEQEYTIPFSKLEIIKGHYYSQDAQELSTSSILLLDDYKIVFTAFTWENDNNLPAQEDGSETKYGVDIYKKNILVQSQVVYSDLRNVFKFDYDDASYFIIKGWDGGVSCCGTIQPMIYRNGILKLGKALNIGKNYNRRLDDNTVTYNEDLKPEDFFVKSNRLFFRMPFGQTSIFGFDLSNASFFSIFDNQIKGECEDDLDICYAKTTISQ